MYSPLHEPDEFNDTATFRTQPSAIYNSDSESLKPGDSVSQLVTKNTIRKPLGPRTMDFPIFDNNGYSNSIPNNFIPSYENPLPISRKSSTNYYQSEKLKSNLGLLKNVQPIEYGIIQEQEEEQAGFNERDYHQNYSHYSPPREDSTNYQETKEFQSNSYPPPSLNTKESQSYSETTSATTKQRRFTRLFWDNRPVEERIQDYQCGVGVQKRAFLCIIFAIVMIIVLILELVAMAKSTGSAIQTNPFNFMLGPSALSLISSGARFTPCMKSVPDLPPIWTCVNGSNSAVPAISDLSCSLADICGGASNQTYRFFIPIFLHAGIVHLILNLLALLLISSQIEKEMGSFKFLLVFIPAGIFGFILGGNFSLVGIPSLGASGSLFASEGALLVDLVAHWKITTRPFRRAIFLILEIAVGLIMGVFIPGIDNFSHVGGFTMGLLISLLLFPIIHQSKAHRITFIIFRIFSTFSIFLLFYFLTRNFYTSDPASSCSFCRYLSCWPTASNNRCQGTGLQTQVIAP